MKNFVQRGDSITVSAPAKVVSGEIVEVGNLIGVASTDAKSGENVAIAVEGVFELPKAQTDGIAVGDTVYFDSAAGAVTVEASGNAEVGIAVTAADNPSSAVDVRLAG